VILLTERNRGWRQRECTQGSCGLQPASAGQGCEKVSRAPLTSVAVNQKISSRSHRRAQHAMNHTHTHTHGPQNGEHHGARAAATWCMVCHSVRQNNSCLDRWLCSYHCSGLHSACSALGHLYAHRVQGLPVPVRSNAQPSRPLSPSICTTPRDPLTCPIRHSAQFWLVACMPPCAL
jgi:hypothetical protein